MLAHKLTHMQEELKKLEQELITAKLKVIQEKWDRLESANCFVGDVVRRKGRFTILGKRSSPK